MTRATATTTRTVLVIWLTSIATVLLLFAAPVADAQSPATVPRIGYVWSGPPGSDPEEVRGFRQGLREVGYVEGRNLLIEYRYAGGDIDRVPQLIAGLLDLKVAILITPGTPVTAIAKREAGALPIVTVVNDPVGAGFAKSLARPGGTFTSMSGTRTTAVIIVNDPFFSAQRAQIAQLVASHRIAAFAGLGHFVESGALMSYGPSLFDLFRRSANWIDKILKGAKPADLAIEQPTLFELVINAKTAKALGLTMPRSLLLRADRIIDR